jgi:flavodoxin
MVATSLNAKTLIVYYSFTNNIRTVINELSTQIEADVLEVLPKEENVDYAANNYITYLV